MATTTAIRPYRTVLVPLDGSDFSAGALAAATAATGRDGGAMYLARVHEPVLAYAGPLVGTEPVLDYERDTETRLEQSETLQVVAQGLKERTGLAVHWAVLDDGAVAEVLHDHAQDLGADLIVMSTHGRTGVARTLFGNVAAKLVRNTHLPVLVVRPDAAAPAPTLFFRKIAVLLDGSELAEQVIEPALRLGANADATIELVRVVTPTPIPMAPGPLPLAMVDAQTFEEETSVAALYLERTAATLRARGITVTTRLERAGQAPQAIADLVARERVDAVAMATHGRSGVSRALLGSVADEVVRRVNVPVLLYRPTVT